MSEIQLLNGAFTATLVKGEDGKQRWQYSPNLKKIGKKPIAVGNEKEKPQFEIINEIEQAATKRYQSVLKDAVLEVGAYLKKLTK